ncbi:hypothetical protein LTR37_006903 [Vermiconidia calcicola]|uniref:Uncharacterized protein n=1 Tax=Vermiconidia calcicola TaxID=1690605 RepID=A0ACC3NFZ0_9PEZI|nr:hypothetical protein LTR37_006903 [Vermiconidia calcicola]
MLPEHNPTMMGTKHSSPKFVFDYPRSCSNLFGKMFSAHPQVQFTKHPYFAAAAYGPEKIELKTASKDVPPDAPTGIEGQWAHMTHDRAKEELEEKLVSAEREGKVALLQEHAGACMKYEVVYSLLSEGRLPETSANPSHI